MSQYATAAEAKGAPGAAAYVRGVSDADIDTALQRASAIIDAYISTRVTLPLSSTPPSLVQACIHIAAWYLASAKGLDAGGVGNTAKKWHDWWLEWLAKVAEGKVPLPGAGDPSGGGSGGARVSTCPPRGW